MKKVFQIFLFFILVSSDALAQQDVFKRYHDIPDINNYAYFYSDYYDNNLIIIGNYID